jgi:phenylpropionate dioxygenase-like ring-hydroxylating dioxygenase large terminal subunit
MWYAVLSSRELRKNRIVAVRRFSQDLIFFRNSAGEVGCVTSLCAHRGASLSKGCIRNDNIQCPFHGIEYDVTGKCVFVPSDGKASEADLHRFNLKH